MNTRPLFYLRRRIPTCMLAIAAAAAMTVEALAAVSCEGPPVLSSPLTYTDKCPGDSGFPQDVRAGNKDVYIKLPANRDCTKSLTVTDARNIRLTGGKFVLGETQQAIITIRGLSSSSGTTFIDGLYLDVNRKSADAIRTYKRKGRFIVQNTYFKGISGTLNGTHGDIVHAQNEGPLDEVKLQNVTALTGYQGLFVPYRPGTRHGTLKLTLDRVNISYEPGLSQRSLKLIYLGANGNSTDQVPPNGSYFSNVYLNGSYWRIPYYQTSYAEPKPTSHCSTYEAKHKVQGEVCDGALLDGDFAPAAQVGRGYDRSSFCY